MASSNLYFLIKRVADVFLNGGILYFFAWSIGPSIGIKVDGIPFSALQSAGWIMLLGGIVVSAGLDDLAERFKP